MRKIKVNVMTMTLIVVLEPVSTLCRIHITCSQPVEITFYNKKYSKPSFTQTDQYKLDFVLSVNTAFPIPVSSVPNGIQLAELNQDQWTS